MRASTVTPHLLARLSSSPERTQKTIAGFAIGALLSIPPKHTATHIHPELQSVREGDRIATGSIETDPDRRSGHPRRAWARAYHWDVGVRARASPRQVGQGC